MYLLSVWVLCGSPVWPSAPVVGPLRGPPLFVGPLWVGSCPVVFLFPVASVPRLASRSRSRSRSSLSSKTQGVTLREAALSLGHLAVNPN